MNQRRTNLDVVLQILGGVVLVLAGVALVFWIVDALPWTVSWDIWGVLTAIGTVGAALVAVLLGLGAWIRDKDVAARVVSAWVTDEYAPRPDGSSYKRKVVVHVANEGNEPVFAARVNVLLGRHRTPVGPLAAPAPIAVIAPRRELAFDISTPLLAHSNSWSPLATLTFTDSRGKRWLRDADGELHDVSKERPRWSKASEPGDERQLGDTSLLNPMMIAMAFLAGLRDTETNPDDLQATLAPEAHGWARTDLQQLRTQLERYQPTSMVDYPAPRIARVKLSGDQSLEGRTVEGEGVELNDYMFITLTLIPERGWRIFSVGESIPPDLIDFDGTLGDEVQPLTDWSDFMAPDSAKESPFPPE